MRTCWGFVVPSLVVFAAWQLGGCGQDIICGPGTHRIGDVCLADDGTTPPHDAGTTTPPPPPLGDGGTTTPPPPPGDGGGWSTSPPVDGSTSAAPPGCDDGAGECAMWAREIFDALAARQAAAGCRTPPAMDARVTGIADRHAHYQASVDRLDASSPDGNLFRQISDAGVHYSDAAALFSVTRHGSADVMDRWAADTGTAPYLTLCGYIVGVGVATSSSGASYVSVLMAKL